MVRRACTRPAATLLLLLLLAGSACTPPEPAEPKDQVGMVRIGTAAPATTTATTATTTAPSTASTDESTGGDAAATTVPVADPSTTAPAGTDDSTVASTAAPPEHAFTVARAVGGWLDTYRSPVDTEVWWSLSNPGPYEGDRVVLVLDQQDDWLLVDIPVRPNGTTAWVHSSYVTLSTHDARILVDLSEMRLWAWEDGVLVAEGAIALGTDETPTPPGRYFLNEIQAQDDPDTLFGSWILGTSGFSEVLEEVEGGDPAVAIHGTNDPSVLGTRVSLGCIRVHEDVVARLALLPLGTPVEVRA
jgi:lipoprotein-anchoring transpeptidase ErfK/SrfK